MTSNGSVGIVVQTPTTRNLDTVLRSIRDQTLEPDEILLVGHFSPDSLRHWINDLPIRRLDPENRNPSSQFNRALESLSSDYIVRAESHDYWEPQFLESLIELLTKNPNAAAAGGVLVPGESLTTFQKDAWCVLNHPLGTGAPGFTEFSRSDEEGTLRSPLYRREALESVGGLPEELPWAESEALHGRLKSKGWKLLRHPEVKLYLHPPDTLGDLRDYFLGHGQGRGRLGARGLFPSDRHQNLDRALMLWTLGLSWNPVG